MTRQRHALALCAILAASTALAQTVPEQVERFVAACVDEDSDDRTSVTACDRAVELVERSGGVADEQMARLLFARARRNVGIGLGEDNQSARDRAREDLERSLALRPLSDEASVARFWLGRLDAEDGKHYEATERFAVVIRDDAELAPFALTLRGQSWWRKDHGILARLDYNAALRLDPKNASALYFRGALNGEEGRVAEALADYTAALEAAPGHLSARYNRALIQIDRKNHGAALADLDELIGRSPGAAHYFNKRGDVHARMNDQARAIADYRTAARLAPDNIGYRKDLEAAMKQQRAKR